MAYRKINPLLWDDDWFIGLDDFHRLVWQAILTGPQVRNIPGLMVASAVTLADFMRRSPEAVAGALAKFTADGKVELDERARMLRVVNAPKWAAEHGEPENPNVVKGWWRAWKELPDCDVKRRHLAGLRDAFVVARDRSVAGERDAEKARTRTALWDSTWTTTFGTAPRPRDTGSGTVSRTMPEPFQNGPGTTREPFPEPSSDPPGMVPARARARKEQEPEQEQEPKQEPEPESSRAGARAPTPARETTGTATDERTTKVIGWLQQSDDLAVLEAAGQLDLVRCARDLIANGDSYVVGGRLRPDEVDERLEAAVSDLAREVAAAASTPQPMPPREIARKLRTFANTTLGKSREEWSRHRRPAGPGHAEDIQAVLKIFGEVWAAKKRRPFVAAAGDEKHAADLAERARTHAPTAKTRPGDLVRFWAERHLASQDRFVVDSDHALRTLGKELTTYGLPRTPADKPNGARERPSQPEAPPAPPPPDFLALAGRLGRGPQPDGPPGGQS